MALGHGVNFVDLAVGPDYETHATAGLVAVMLVGLGLLAKRSVARSSEPLVPEDHFSVRSVVELVVLFVVTLSDNTLGKENRKYLPFLVSLFFYLLLGNLIGLVPGFSTPNDSLQFNFGMALTVFVVYHAVGIWEVGPLNYFKHFWGPYLLLGFLIFPIELISHCFRPMTLTIRLWANMFADHLVLGIFTDLTKLLIPVLFYGLGTFVCMMQAFVFTLLTMIYIRLATAHEEGHEHAHAEGH